MPPIPAGAAHAPPPRRSSMLLLSRRPCHASPPPAYALRPQHVAGLHHPIKGLRVDKAETDRLLLQRRAVLVRGLRHLGRVVVADRRRQRGHEHQALAHQLGDPLLVRLDADDAVVGERRRGVADQRHRLQHVVGDHRLVDVELEMPLAAGEADRGVVAHHLRAGHGQRLGLGRVDLARHDRRPRLVLRQDQLAEPAARPRPEQPDVVGDLEEAHRHRLQRPRHLDHRVVRRQRLELVRRGDERQPGDLGDPAPRSSRRSPSGC